MKTETIKNLTGNVKFALLISVFILYLVILLAGLLG